MSLVATSLERLGSHFPSRWAASRQGDIRPAGFDEAWQIRIDGKLLEVTLWIAAQRESVGPEEARRLAYLSASRVPGRVPVVVAPYVSPTARRLLESAGIAYIDSTGNARLWSDDPPLLVSTHGADRNPTPPPGGHKQTLGGDAAGAIVRALLDHRPPYTQRRIAEAAGTSPAEVSRTLRLLKHEGLVEAVVRGTADHPRLDYVDLDWPATLRRWAIDYSQPTAWQGRYVAVLGLETFGARLAAFAGRYAVTGRAAVHALSRVAPLDEFCVYVDDPDALAATCGLVPADPLQQGGLTVRLIRPSAEYVYARAVRDPASVQGRGPHMYAAYSQVVVDLLVSGGRGPAEGEAQIERMRQHEPDWRRAL